MTFGGREILANPGFKYMETCCHYVGVTWLNSHLPGYVYSRLNGKYAKHMQNVFQPYLHAFDKTYKINAEDMYVKYY